MKDVNQYDLIVLDEIEAILSVFSSSTCKYQLDIWNLLVKFVNNSKKTIFAGAFITQKTIDYITSFNLPTICIKNEYKPIQKIAVEIPCDILILKLLESIQRGEKNYCCYSSLTKMKEDISFLLGSKDTIVIDVMTSPGKLLTYSSEGDDIIQKDSLQNIDKYWGDARLIMTTPTITVGNSYKPDIPDFTNIWIIGSPTCIIADTFQSHRRVRETTSNTLYFSYPNPKSLSNGKRLFDYKNEILNTYYERNETNAMKLQYLICELITMRQNQMYMEQIENRRVDLESIYFNFAKNRNLSPDNLKDLLMFNFKEQTISNCYYKEMFAQFLLLNNYDVVRKITRTQNDNDTLLELETNKVDHQISYLDIPKIDENECEKLRFKKEHKQATRLEKLQIDKYYFDKDCNNPILTDGDRTAWFEECILTTSNLQYFKNLKSEINKSVDNGIRGDSTNETINTHPIRLSYILKLNDLLGIPNSAADVIYIPREKIESNNEFFEKEYKNIVSAFQFGSKITKLWDTSNSIKLIQQIYKSWFKFSKLETKKDIHNKVIAIVKLQPLAERIIPFIPITEIILLPVSLMEVEETKYNLFIQSYNRDQANRRVDLEKREEEKEEHQRIEYEIMMEKRGNDAFRFMEQEKKDKKFKHEHQCLITNFLE